MGVLADGLREWWLFRPQASSQVSLVLVCVVSLFFFLQLENLSNFIKSLISYGLKPVDLFEANDLYESGNMTQVQVSLLALAGMVRELTRWRLLWV